MKTFYLAPSDRSMCGGQSSSPDPNAYQMYGELEEARSVIGRWAHNQIIEVQFGDLFVETMVSKMLTFMEGGKGEGGEERARPYLGAISGAILNFNEVSGLFYDEEEGRIEVVLRNGESRFLDTDIESAEMFDEQAKRLVLRMG